MMRLLTVLLLIASAVSFTSPHPWSRSTSMQKFMVDKEQSSTEAPALQTLDEITPNAATPAKPKYVVREMNTGELKEVSWVDPAMKANTNPLMMSW